MVNKQLLEQAAKMIAARYVDKAWSLAHEKGETDPRYVVLTKEGLTKYSEGLLEEAIGQVEQFIK